jgi:hypothetical protein
MTVFIFKLEKDAINSGKGSVFFEMSYNPKNHYPEYLSRLMREHPVTLEYREKGYVGPVSETQYIKDWEEELSNIDDEIAMRLPHKKGFPVQYYDAVRKKETLLRVKELYEAGLVILEK